ncbi:MAG: hypothetical protein GFH27_549319n34 [Chloroflexi bacterium AL-W]|nr:hypothetical protein [Chloroflexi bacterium AL-N1]NOK70580.1 hypothetical protein [Chloroflexi bacterium AL-N10]NOK77572.1 hypothetical protein [Chloroflexi bacterium AL-N5]NOK84423.1 hypothetical protein [Chloroflexi bacterium AL-W]NOK92312.1 hypothetical protein [Chloroflexi bacterium AL-N15]
MSIKNTVTSLVLTLLFFSLIAIFLATSQNALVTGLSVIILAVSLIIGLTGSWRELGIMAGFTGLVSLVAASLVGGAMFNNIGAFLFTLIWGVVLLFIALWVQRNMLFVSSDRDVLVTNTYTGITHIAPKPVAPPLMPFLEVKVAEIPLYTMLLTVSVDTINTAPGYNLNRIDFAVAYKIVDPRQARRSIANRGSAQQEVAKQLGQDVNQARNNVVFWERLIGKQLSGTMDGIVREVVYESKLGPVDAYKNRHQLLGKITDDLTDSLAARGIEIIAVEFDFFDVDRESFRRANRERYWERDTKLKRIEAEREAERIRIVGEAQAEAEADRVAMLVRSLRESGIDLSPEDLEDIVISAIRASSEFEGDYVRLLPEPLPNAKPADKKVSAGK